jgi:hypothetical protein
MEGAKKRCSVWSLKPTELASWLKWTLRSAVPTAACHRTPQIWMENCPCYLIRSVDIGMDAAAAKTGTKILTSLIQRFESPANSSVVFSFGMIFILGFRYGAVSQLRTPASVIKYKHVIAGAMGDLTIRAERTTVSAAAASNMICKRLSHGPTRQTWRATQHALLC